MTKGLKDQVIGSIVMLIIVGIPLGFIFTPVVTLAFVVGALWGIVRESRASAAPQKRKIQPKSTKLSKADEELITAILPVINSK